jgi:hypothetical protein
MAYTINLTNGTVLTTIPDGTINTSSTSLTLIGKNYAGYGQFLDDNFVHILENGANSTAPTTALTGQLWYNTTNNSLQVWNGSAYKNLAQITTSTTAPVSGNPGDLWYDTTNAQLDVYTGNAWVVVGPLYTASTGKTGVIPGTIVDNTSTSHVIANIYVGGNVLGIISEDSSFHPQVTIPGFTGNINPGIQLASVVNSQVPYFQGTATNAAQLSGIQASQFMRADANTATTGSITVNSAGLQTAIINGAGASIGNIGTANVPFNMIYATASTAQYADVAERFAADDVYEAGTVVELGGAKEITMSTTELSDSVFGVISKRAAYLMNGGAGDDITHPPVAMTGRVPVQVTGIVNKGDRLVSAGAGMARAAKPGEATAFNVIGRALVSKTDEGVGTVEAIVTIK